MTEKLESTLVGVAGEYFVAAELSARSHIASITLRNSRGIDILASNSDASKTVSIQVKTNSGGKPVWLLSKSAETFVSATHFYVFVRLGAKVERPEYHIVPSCDVAEFAATSHANWLAGMKRDGSKRKDSTMRKFKDPDNKYKDCWELLGL